MKQSGEWKHSINIPSLKWIECVWTKKIKCFPWSRLLSNRLLLKAAYTKNCSEINSIRLREAKKGKNDSTRRSPLGEPNNKERHFSQMKEFRGKIITSGLIGSDVEDCFNKESQEIARYRPFKATPKALKALSQHIYF